MKIFLQITFFIFFSIISIHSNAQTVVYADSVIAFSTEYSASAWSAQKIKGAPDAYPLCEDNSQAWAPSSSNGGRNWIELYYSAPINVDTVSIFETFNAGAVDTVYLRNTFTNTWDVVYTNTAVFTSTCNVLKIGMPQTLYPIDAVRFSLNLTVSFQEYDAVSLKNNTLTTSVKEANHVNNPFTMYPNPTKGNITLKVSNSSGTNNLVIYSILGNKVYEQSLVNEIETIDTKLTSGVYFVEVNNASNNKSIHKLIVE